MEQKFYICKHCGNIIAKVRTQASLLSAAASR